MHTADYIDLLSSVFAVKGDLDDEDQATLEQNFKALHLEITGSEAEPGMD